MIPPTTIADGAGVPIPTTAEVITPAVPINILSDCSSKYEDESDYGPDTEEELDAYTILYDKEDEHVTFFRDLVPETVEGLESMVFSQKDLDTLKEKEQNLRNKEDSNYFRSKISDASLYEQIKESMAPYLQDDKIKMLAHPWSTQLNEAMNNSVASNAPKTKNFCGTTSLLTRVGISGAVMALGYEEFWTRVFTELNLEMDSVFRGTLRTRDVKKDAKRVRQRSKQGKIKRREKYYATMAQSHTEQMNDAKTGNTYGSGVALKEATKKAKETLTAAARNPKDCPKELQRCSYHHPLYCTALGHTAASSLLCAMKKKTKEERKVISDHIKKLRIEEELVIVQDTGKSRQYVFFVLLWHIIKSIPSRKPSNFV